MQHLQHLLEVDNLSTSFFTYAGEVRAVSGVSFHVDEGEALGIVGESGCGKSVTVQSVMRLIPNPPGKIVGGQIRFLGQDLVKLSEKQMTEIRGKSMGMIFQDPMTSLNPVLTIGRQMTEVLQRHEGIGKQEAMERAEKYLEMVGIPNAKRRLKQYPHEFSGGMRQRVMIALALLCNPKLLIADEPTTALDVTIQAQILELMKDLKQKINTSIILITHDLGVVAGLCSRIIVMYGGKIVESGTVHDIFKSPQHPYTWGLLKSVPRLDDQSRTKLLPINGTPPDLLQPPVGCGFTARCSYAMKICAEKPPEVTEICPGHQAACWLLHHQAPKNAFSAKGGVE
ncbi:oligopeptide/dipeptide ABC transporter, ATP-binding protein [Desulfosporosinus orientis DSM 765]|uniref:Oligopeptide/dipeptide ABC transporter, ATP-binding protein n=1 Tax=Desulfosporosinus orientis (strain ATCC 19365 / DSM 765 / NCIMB 8382 / VKM B-1628 / Singapore I) TaxID=768706 RepID=G7W5S6_DESOD|nr:ABC transporter ATP-binding protein [Desulfosporosinus orientis]AET67014.1 oligopeptide/dipeptide ABC transporter, ATP-binding protein [Desulfosporosinus orientis DSM 765]